MSLVMENAVVALWPEAENSPRVWQAQGSLQVGYATPAQPLAADDLAYAPTQPLSASCVGSGVPWAGTRKYLFRFGRMG